MSIANECMVTNLSIAVWTGHRIDKDASRKVTTEASADDDAARVNKHLVPKETLKSVIQAQGALRLHFYKHTLPWRDNGDRLLTRKRFQPFITEHGALKTAFDEAVNAFVEDAYLTVRDRASFRMGGLFNADDYPRPDVLRRKFGVVLDIDAVSEAGDFRVNLDKEHLDRMRLDVQDRTTERLNRAMENVWQRLASAVGKMAERLSDKDATFRNSMIENLREVVELLPDLNITDDPALERIRVQVEQHLSQYDPKDLRDNDVLRSQVAETATNMYAEISGIMRAFGAGDE